ncbi:15708_t:CDS:2, partial [Acaulospora colombiana]
MARARAVMDGTTKARDNQIENVERKLGATKTKGEKTGRGRILFGGVWYRGHDLNEYHKFIRPMPIDQSIQGKKKHPSQRFWPSCNSHPPLSPINRTLSYNVVDLGKWAPYSSSVVYHLAAKR